MVIVPHFLTAAPIGPSEDDVVIVPHFLARSSCRAQKEEDVVIVPHFLTCSSHLAQRRRTW